MVSIHIAAPLFKTKEFEQENAEERRVERGEFCEAYYYLPNRIIRAEGSVW
jgi:hypothetical protein